MKLELGSELWFGELELELGEFGELELELELEQALCGLELDLLGL